ncbi:MAG TPA: AMP-binding protein, partial [Stellaceae bacterium]|nr:AMP-binding protein [Stellaceae bacterium]
MRTHAELFATPRIVREDLPGGGMILRSKVPLPPLPRSTGVWLARWAAEAPERGFLAERDGAGGWRRVSYREAYRDARAIGQALVDRGLGAARPLMILSENSIDHALLTLGALEAGVPVVPVSTAYSLISRDYGKLKAIADLVEPGLVYASNGLRYALALEAIGRTRAEIAVSAEPPPGWRITDFQMLLKNEPGAGLEDAAAAVGPDTVAKILFTSGSTGDPKGVINTQRMLASNQESLALIWPFLEQRPPVLVDWPPWNHTFGGNHDF